MPRDIQDDLAAALGPAYAIERQMFSGTVARAYLVRETALDRLIVVKVLPRESAIGVSAERFRREIRLAATLQHPNLVPLLMAGESDRMLHYAMPYVAGESLRQRLERDGQLPVAEVVALLAEVADALDTAHQAGYVHRDIKPDNILLSHGHALLTDFGVAKALAAAAVPPDRERGLTSVGTIVGTPTYMAPEQAAGDPATDHRADLYALGITAYELLAGSPPFTYRLAQQQLAAHAAEPPPPLAARRSDVTPALEGLIARLLAKDPAARPASAAAVRRALSSIASGSPAGSPVDQPAAGRAAPPRRDSLAQRLLGRLGRRPDR